MKNESKLTWKDVVKEALAEIGNSGHLDDINSQIEGHWKTKTNPTWKDTVRRTLQQYSIFYQEEKGSGIIMRFEKHKPQMNADKRRCFPNAFCCLRFAFFAPFAVNGARHRTRMNTD